MCIRDRKNDGQKTPLHLAVQYGQLSIVKHLIECGAQIDPKDTSDRTPLHFAQNLSIVKHLHERGAQINSKDTDGRTLLHFAAQLKKKDPESTIGKYLLEHGAKVHLKDIEGFTPLDLAIHAGHMGFFKIYSKSCNAK